jgi:nitroreductase
LERTAHNRFTHVKFDDIELIQFRFLEVLMIKELVEKNRSYRRFYQDHVIDRSTLCGLVDLARQSMSGRNMQPLKYILSCEPATNAQIFSTLAWAGYLKDWKGPVEGERPSAYIIVLGDRELTQNFGVDHGIACTNILLGAVDQGLGGCIVATIKRVDLARFLNIPDRFEILFVVALGKPKEKVVVDTVGPDGDIKYWRDANNVHHVPKRSLDDLIIG